MARYTTIEFADSSVNLFTGCSGCELWNPTTGGNCYAATLSQRFEKRPPFDRIIYGPDADAATVAANWPAKIEDRRPRKPWLDFRPRIIMANDMGDTFDAQVPDALIIRLLAAIGSTAGRRHVWLIFTKRVLRAASMMARAGYHIPNLVLFASVTSLSTAYRLSQLATVSNCRLGISYEPTLGFIPNDRWPIDLMTSRRMTWLIAGAETGTRARQNDPERLRQAVRIGAAHGIPTFIKSLGTRSGIPHSEGPRVTRYDNVNLPHWPAELRVRQTPDFTDVVAANPGNLFAGQGQDDKLPTP